MDFTKEFTTYFKLLNFEVWSWVSIVQSHISLMLKWGMELITDFLLKLETWGSVFVVKGPICNITYLFLGLVIEQVNPFYLLI